MPTVTTTPTYGIIGYQGKVPVYGWGEKSVLAPNYVDPLVLWASSRGMGKFAPTDYTPTQLGWTAPAPAPAPAPPVQQWPVTAPGPSGPGLICPAWGCSGLPVSPYPVQPAQPYQPIYIPVPTPVSTPITVAPPGPGDGSGSFLPSPGIADTAGLAPSQLPNSGQVSVTRYTLPNGAFVNLDAGIVTGPDGTPRLIPPGLTPDQVNAWANSLTADSSQPVSRPDLAIYQAEDLSSRQSLWPGVTGPSFDQPSVDLFAPSGASLVADAVGPSDDIQATIMQQQDSLYRSGPADDIWGATFGEFGLQLPVRPRPGRTYHRRLTAIQTINEGPVLLDEFSQAAWLSPVLTAATGIGSAAITAALAPRPVIQAQAPVFIAQPPAAPPSSLQAQSQGVGHSALQILDQDKWVIIGGIGALALLFIMMRKK